MARWYIIHAYSGFENKVKGGDPFRSRAHWAWGGAGRSGGSAVGNHHRGEARQESANRAQDHARLCAGQAGDER